MESANVKVANLLDKTLNEGLDQIILSNSMDKEFAAKIKIRPLLVRGELCFQETIYRGTQVFHENFDAQTMKTKIIEYLENRFKQGEIKTTTMQAVILVSKKGNMTVKTKMLAAPKTEAARDLSHNREKQYILKEGIPVDFLVGLGVQTPDGKISKNRYDKFRQINRYLEFIEDILDKLPKEGTIRIVDFGCGKSYLTFAMYYYLHELQKRDVEIVGLDLKKDVIKHCNQLAKECGYDKLSFEVGDISTYEGATAVDMVVSLHACDTATDYAIEKALGWKAKVIMAVPCCQHEVNKQIKNKELQPILKYGLIKERISALITDAIRANLLEEQGYETQILEFIDMEHTPKNLLIRAVRKGNGGDVPMLKKKQSVEEVLEFLQLDPTLNKLLK